MEVVLQLAGALLSHRRADHGQAYAAVQPAQRPAAAVHPPTERYCPGCKIGLPPRRRAERRCLSCTTTFVSESSSHRVCPTCKPR